MERHRGFGIVGAENDRVSFLETVGGDRGGSDAQRARHLQKPAFLGTMLVGVLPILMVGAVLVWRD